MKNKSMKEGFSQFPLLSEEPSGPKTSACFPFDSLIVFSHSLINRLFVYRMAWCKICSKKKQRVSMTNFPRPMLENMAQQKAIWRHLQSLWIDIVWHLKAVALPLKMLAKYLNLEFYRRRSCENTP